MPAGNRMTPRKILIVEDVDMIADYIRMVLTRHGYQSPDAVASGEEAVETIFAAPPDLVLMDIKLDGLINGIEAAEIIRRQFDIPIVFVSAHPEPAIVNRAMATGAAGYLVKPFKGKDLLSAVKRALTLHDAGKYSGNPPTVNHPHANPHS